MDPTLPVAEFGFPGPLRDRLVAAILDGTKTSTTALLASYVHEGLPLPEPGRREQVVDSEGRPVAVIEYTEVRLGTRRDVDDAFAIEEGEGFRDVGEWWESHARFFGSPAVRAELGNPDFRLDDTTQLVLQRFRLVSPRRRESRSEAYSGAMTELLDAAHEIAPQVVADRRAIHQNPELMYRERETAALVASRLDELGIPHRDGVGGTGVVGLIEGGRSGRTVLLRADMDCLPIQEENDLPFKSRNAGRMHACGHDSHTAILLGAARLLHARRSDLTGNVKLMFQPAEEGGAGAVRMIEEGVLENPSVDGAFMLHVNHSGRTGDVATAPGPVLAGADSWKVTVEGQGGHASRPQFSVDPVVVAAQIVTALQTLVSRETAPYETAVLTIGSVHAGTAHNIIPDRAVLEGTIRAYDDALMERLERRLREVAEGVAQAMRAKATVEFEMRYPPTVNDAAMAELAAGALRRVLGASHVHDADPNFAAEDFSFVLQRVPGAALMLGVRHPSWTEPKPVHTPRFQLDEDAIPVGVASMTAVALEFLGS